MLHALVGPEPGGARLAAESICGRADLGRTVHSRDMGYSTPDIREKALW